VIVGTSWVAAPWGLLGGLASAGVSFGAYPPIVRTLVQTSVPPEKRGEILSVRAALIGLGVPVGGLLAGVANTVLIPSTVIALTGALAALVGLMIWTLLQVTRSSK
jgi:MFS family permease